MSNEISDEMSMKYVRVQSEMNMKSDNENTMEYFRVQSEIEMKYFWVRDEIRAGPKRDCSSTSEEGACRMCVEMRA